MGQNVSTVLSTFAKLGLTSFGGPVAHLGYFRTEFVTKKRWLSDREYADLVALCQFLPGPASSQVSMAIGLQRAGVMGLLAAWFAFTAPSALALIAFAYGAGGLSGGWIVGLKAAAVGVVAHALVGMARSLTPDLRRVIIAALAFAVTMFVAGPAAQVGAILAGAACGLAMCRPEAGRAASFRVSARAGMVCLALWALLLALLPFVSPFAAMFYRAGSLVFGGGHVVLPLLQAETAGIVATDVFLAGYGVAQAVPGPLFTFAAYLGAVADPPHGGIAGAVIALVAIFLPAALLLVPGLALWSRISSNVYARRAMSGMNAAVVGILASAFVSPVLPAGVLGWGSGMIALASFLALWKVPAWLVVLLAALAGAVVGA